MILEQIGYNPATPRFPVSEPAAGVPLDWKTVWSRPLPHMNRRTRFACRSLLSLFRRRVLAVEGLEHAATANDPFILALNHSQRIEAMLIPALLSFLRDGRMIHFMCDWNFLMIPVVGGIIRCNDVIVVGRKSARPKFLNRFKPRYVTGKPVFEQARDRLASGRSIGVFPEGTANRHPNKMLKGYHGVARLSLETGIPVVPAGVRFPKLGGASAIDDSQPFTLHIGSPLKPELPDGHVASPVPAQVRLWHQRIMESISALSGKEWKPEVQRSKYVS